MKSIIVRFAFAVAAILGSVSLSGDANAVNLNQSASAFHGLNSAGQAALGYSNLGVYDTSTSQYVYAQAPIGVYYTTSGSRSFFVDGKNGSIGTCFFLYSVAYTGTLDSSTSTCSSAATYDLTMTLNPSYAYSYVNMTISLPPDQNSVLFGVTAIN